MKTAVLLITFNRLDCVKEVLTAIHISAIFAKPTIPLWCDEWVE